MEFYPVSYYQNIEPALNSSKNLIENTRLILQEKQRTKQGFRWKYVTFGIVGLTALATLCFGSSNNGWVGVGLGMSKFKSQQLKKKRANYMCNTAGGQNVQAILNKVHYIF